MSTPFLSDYLRVAEDSSDRPSNPVTGEPGTNPEMIAFRYEKDTQTLILWDPDTETYITVSLGGVNASTIVYDNSGSGLSATDVQAAIDELAAASSGYTDEQAQDAVGAMIDGTLVYVDVTPLLTRAALTGDVTAAQGSNATTIANDAVSNTKAANMAAWTYKIRNAGSSGDPSDAALADFTTESSPATGDFVVGFLDTGEIRKYNVSNFLSAAGVTAPTVVQTATDRSTAGNDTTLSPTFGSNTTVGNYLVFIVAGAATGTVVISNVGLSAACYVDSNHTSGNQGINVFIHKIAAAAAAYSVTIASPNGGESVVAIELDGLSDFEFNWFRPYVTGATLNAPLFYPTGALTYYVLEADNDMGALVSATSGLTHVYTGTGATNHGSHFFTVDDTLDGVATVVTTTTNPTATANVAPLAALLSFAKTGRF